MNPEAEIRKAISDYLAYPSILPDLIALAKHLDALPVYADLGGALFLRPDGQILSVHSNQEWGANSEWKVETDAQWQKVALIKASERFPNLRFLRPNDSETSKLEHRRLQWFDEYCRQLDMNSVLADPSPGTHYPCPCCRFATLPSRGHFEICPVCFWEDDGQDDHDAEVMRGGPNGKLTLAQARENYQLFGACDERFRGAVRPPKSDELS